MRKEVKASKKYWFVWQEELNHPCAFDAFLFNDPAHLALQPSQNRYSYYLIKKHDEVIHARCTFFIEDQVAYSPYKGSFGSIEFSEKVFFELLEEYWDYIEADLCSKGVKEIFIKNYPVCYNPPHAQMLSFLFSTKGFNIQSQELNFHIEVDEVEFYAKLHAFELKKLKSGLAQHFLFEIEKEINYKELHSFIHKARTRKGYPVSISENDLCKVLERFPSNFQLFTLKSDGNWVSICIVIEVNSSTLYTFLGADSEDFLRYSPSVLLHDYLYDFAKKKKHKIIDLGIGSDRGNINKGLVRFKEKIGGIVSSKTLFKKALKF